MIDFDPSRYINRRITDAYALGKRRAVFKVEGLPPIIHTVTSASEHDRRAKLRELLWDVSRTNTYPWFFWTMRDFAWALNLPLRWSGLIGRDLKALGVYRGLKVTSRRKVYGLTDARTQKPIPHCAVFCATPFATRPRDIQKAYRLQAKDRLAACQQIRSRG